MREFKHPHGGIAYFRLLQLLPFQPNTKAFRQPEQFPILGCIGIGIDFAVHPERQQGIPVAIDSVQLRTDFPVVCCIALSLCLGFGPNDALEPLEDVLVLNFEGIEQGENLRIEDGLRNAVAGVVAFVVGSAPVVAVFASAFMLGLADDGTAAMAAGDEAVSVSRFMVMVGFSAEQDLHPLEGGDVDEGFMVAGTPCVMETHFADVGAVGQDGIQLASGEGGEFVGVGASFVPKRLDERIEAVAVESVEREYAPHVGRPLRMDAHVSPSVLAIILVPIWSAAGEEAALHPPFDAFLCDDGKLVAVELAEGGEHVGIEFSGRRFVERFGDAYDLDAVLVAHFRECDPILHVAGGAVDFVEQKTVDSAGIAPGMVEHFMERHALFAFVGGFNNTVHFADGAVVFRRPGTEGVFLNVQAEPELLVIRGNAGKGEVVFHGVLSCRASSRRMMDKSMSSASESVKGSG